MRHVDPVRDKQLLNALANLPRHVLASIWFAAFTPESPAGAFAREAIDNELSHRNAH